MASYVRPNPVHKAMFWDNIKERSSQVSLPWLVADDLNDIAMASEKFGGAPLNLSRADLFNKRIHDCQLLDLGYHGPLFTWLGNGRGGNILKERLDRALANDEWRLAFPEAFVMHLPRVCSDHHPILIDLLNDRRGPRNKPFRFEAMWTMHTGRGEGKHEPGGAIAPPEILEKKLVVVLKVWGAGVIKGKIKGRG